MVTVPLVALGIWFASVNGTVQEYDVPKLEAIVPDVPPNVYFNVCVNALLALGMDTVIALPILTLVALKVGVVARGIVSSVPDPDPDTVPILSDPQVIANS